MKKEKNIIPGTLNLLILSLLRDKEKYGYELIEDLKRKSNDTIELKSGTLYPLLHSLEAQNFISSCEKITESKKIRKYYHLTIEGKDYLEFKTKEWNTFSNIVNGIIGGTNEVYG